MVAWLDGADGSRTEQSETRDITLRGTMAVRQRKSKRLAIMRKHRELVLQGQMEVARVLLRLLNRGRVMLGYGDAEFAAECVLERLGCVITYSRPRYVATAHDFGRA